MNLLSRREHSRLELKQKLSRKPTYSADEIQAAIDRLTEQGLQSDERFVENFVRQRFNNGYGPKRIRYELQQRGIEEASVSLVLGELSAGWLEQASALRERRFGDLPQEYADKAKQQRFLQGRGYDFDVINKVFSG